MSTAVAATSYCVSLQLEHSIQHFFSVWKEEHKALGEMITVKTLGPWGEIGLKYMRRETEV